MMRSILLIFFLVFLEGCSAALDRVAPYEREYLAQDKMLAEPMKERSEYEGHVFLSREASEGGESAFQGGCGCR